MSVFNAAYQATKQAEREIVHQLTRDHLLQYQREAIMELVKKYGALCSAAGSALVTEAIVRTNDENDGRDRVGRPRWE
jgi:hypothetical protein